MPLPDSTRYLCRAMRPSPPGLSKYQLNSTPCGPGSALMCKSVSRSTTSFIVTRPSPCAELVIRALLCIGSSTGSSTCALSRIAQVAPRAVRCGEPFPRAHAHDVGVGHLGLGACNEVPAVKRQHPELPTTRPRHLVNVDDALHV